MSTLELEQVSHSFGLVSALREVSVRIGPGLTGLVGPNGAGKTTLLSLAAGAAPAVSGRITIDDTDVWAHPAVFRQLGSVLTSRPLDPTRRVRELLTATALAHGLSPARSHVDRVVELMALEPVLDRRVGTLSLGNQQRLKIALATVHQPQVLLLDEPFNGLDPVMRRRLADHLRGLAADGATIVFSSHILHEVATLVDRVVVLVAGRLAAAGAVEQVQDLLLTRSRRYVLTSSDDRRLGSALAAQPWVDGVDFSEIAHGRLLVDVTDGHSLAQDIAGTAARLQVRLYGMGPESTSLEFLYSALATS